MNSTEALRLLIATRSWSGAGYVIKEHPELLTDEAEALLERWAAEARGRGDDQQAQDYERNGAFLQLCRELGVEDALAELAAQGSPILPVELGALQDELVLAQQDYDAVGDPAALDREINTWERILAHPAFPGASAAVRLQALQSAGQTLTRRYSLRQQDADLDRAIDLFKLAFEAADPSDPEVPNVLSSLGLRLRERYLRKGQPEDIEAAIAWMRASVDPAWEQSQYFTSYLENLAAAELDQYDRTNAAGDLDALIVTVERLVAIGSSGPDFDRHVSDAAWAHAERYRSTERREDLDRAIELYSKSRSAAAGAPDLRANLSDLGWLLLVRYEQDGQVADLHDALDANDEAARVAASGSPEQMLALTHLATALSLRFELTGVLEDLERSIHVYRRAAILPEAELGRPTIIMGLAAALRTSYRMTGDLVRLDEAATLLEDLEGKLPPDSPLWFKLLNGLGNVLADRFGAAHAPADVARAIDLFTQASELAPTLTIKARIMNNLGTALADRFRAGGEAKELDQAIRAFEQAAQSSSAGLPGRAFTLLNLADALHDAFDLRGDVRLAERTVAAYRESCVIGLQVDLQSAAQAGNRWGRWAAERHSWTEAVEAFRICLEAMGRLHATQVRSRDQEAWLEAIRGVPVEASYAMAMADHLSDAVLTQERGRAILASEALQGKRRDLDNLALRGHADLSDRFRRLGDELRDLDWTDGNLSSVGPATEPSPEARASLRAEFNAAVTAIRSVPGFEGFLAPPEMPDVVEASAGPPLAFVMAANEGGLALIVGRDGRISRLLLPELTVAALQARILRQFASYEQPGVSWMNALDDTTRWAWDALMGPLLQAEPVGGNLVLVPAGLLGFLPLHAAWTPNPSSPTGRRYALDDVCLTYAPNARSLIAARRQAERVHSDAILAIEAPSPVSATPLLFAEPEVDAVVAEFDRSRRLSNEEATREAVLAELSEFPVLHFACHGAADVEQPLSSSLLMAHDEQLTLRDLMDAKMDKARIAVLSACETAMTGARLPDEVIGFPNGLMQAGVPGVIGSLWRVPDFAAMSIMSLFYQRWKEDGLEPAEALRHAQRSVRDSGAGPADRTSEGARGSNPPTPASPETAQRQRGLAHPIHWAGFQYVGV